MKILSIEEGGEQGSTAWLRKRAMCITATDSSAINNTNPWTNPSDLYKMKLGLKLPPEMNDKMRLGQTLEPEARAWLNNDTGLNFKPIVALHDVNSWAMASLDGYDADNDVICEIKCPSSNKLFELAEEGTYPPYYYTQMQKQLYVTGCYMCIFLIYRKIDDKVITKIIDIFSDQEFIENMIENEKYFYENYMSVMKDPEDDMRIKLK